MSTGSAGGVVRGTRGGGAGGAHDRPVSVKARPTAAVGTVTVVGGAGRVRRVHPVRRVTQRVARAHGRAPLPAPRPAARRTMTRLA